MAANDSSGTITMEFDLSGHDTAEEAKLWIPYPMSDRDQLISNISVSGDFAELAVYSDQTYSTPMDMGSDGHEVRSAVDLFSWRMTELRI